MSRDKNKSATRRLALLRRCAAGYEGRWYVGATPKHTDGPTRTDLADLERLEKEGLVKSVRYRAIGRAIHRISAYEITPSGQALLGRRT